jgi:1-deoxy-D-xylulose-5-phosphate reductoisomerase
MVQFKDHAIMAQLGAPDMRVPIIYALDYPERYPNTVEPLDFTKLSALTFDQPDFDRFPCLEIAVSSVKVGGIMPTVMNAANEVLVQAYLDDKIGFYDISDFINHTMAKFKNILSPTLDDIFMADQEARNIVKTFFK